MGGGSPKITIFVVRTLWSAPLSQQGPYVVIKLVRSFVTHVRAGIKENQRICVPKQRALSPPISDVLEVETENGLASHLHALRGF